MSVKTLYTVLGVSSSAAHAEIDEAFARLRLQYPQAKLDADDEARVRYQALVQAYETLKTPESRTAYDQRLAKAGIRPTGASAASARPWSARNLALLGIVVVLVSGMWWAHARQKAREEKEIAQKALQIVEEENLRRAEIAAREDERRQAAFDASQQRQEEAQERARRMEAERYSRQVEAERRAAEYRGQTQQTQAQRQEQMRREQLLRQEQQRQMQVDREAYLRLEREKLQLRETCLQRYGRPDC